jgi:hypothetical protein
MTSTPARCSGSGAVPEVLPFTWLSCVALLHAVFVSLVVDDTASSLPTTHRADTGQTGGREQLETVRHPPAWQRFYRLGPGGSGLQWTSDGWGQWSRSSRRRPWKVLDAACCLRTSRLAGSSLEWAMLCLLKAHSGPPFHMIRTV